MVSVTYLQNLKWCYCCFWQTNDATNWYIELYSHWTLVFMKTLLWSVGCPHNLFLVMRIFTDTLYLVLWCKSWNFNLCSPYWHSEVSTMSISFCSIHWPKHRKNNCYCIYILKCVNRPISSCLNLTKNLLSKAFIKLDLFQTESIPKPSYCPTQRMI